jgi:hypothetical protein
MFRASSAPIIRSTQAVVTTIGTSHEFGDIMIKSIKKTPWSSSYLTLNRPNRVLIWPVQSELAARPWIIFNGFYHNITKFMTCTNGCNYSLCTPDDGCGRRPKHVERLGSKINKDCLELHLVGCLKHFDDHRNLIIIVVGP